MQAHTADLQLAWFHEPIACSSLGGHLALYCPFMIRVNVQIQNNVGGFSFRNYRGIFLPFDAVHAAENCERFPKYYLQFVSLLSVSCGI